jgi:hypothetical protein
MGKATMNASYFFNRLLTVVVLVCSAPGLAAEGTLKVRLLGTGGPELFSNRLGYATLVEANGEKLLSMRGAESLSGSMSPGSIPKRSPRSF